MSRMRCDHFDVQWIRNREKMNTALSIEELLDVIANANRNFDVLYEID